MGTFIPGSLLACGQNSNSFSIARKCKPCLFNRLKWLWIWRCKCLLWCFNFEFGHSFSSAKVNNGYWFSGYQKCEKKSSGLNTNTESSVLTFWSQQHLEHLERNVSSQQSVHTMRPNQPQVWCNREQHRWDAWSHLELYKKGSLRLSQLLSLRLDHCCCLRQPASSYNTEAFASASSGSLHKERIALQKIQNMM